MQSLKDLTGDWDGFFSRHHEHRPIHAELEQVGDRLSGKISEEVTNFEASVSELALREHLPPGTDEEIVARVRDLCPEAEPDDPVRAEEMLPSLSSVEGVVDVPIVRFRRTYRGPMFTGFRIGQVRVGRVDEDQEVDCLGTLNEEGTEIRGHWRIRREEPMPLHDTTGTFVFRRKTPLEPGEN